MKTRSPDTIAAIATPFGEGAISVIRTSGPEAISIVETVFRGNLPLSTARGYSIRHGWIVSSADRTVDEVLASVFRSPHSYTGEDSIEISCHGGMLVTKCVLETIIAAGARQADPGEFTKRAFLNGKMDLAQAEAVCDLIQAGSERALRNSTVQLQGLLGEQLQLLKRELIEVCTLLELQLDFSEEDIPAASVQVLEKRMLACRARIDTMIASFGVGKMARDGVSVAIVGRPNAGKSSLFNRLLMEGRAIVSHIPGTTRDFLEESISINGVRFKLIDTAGLRESGDGIEAAGVALTRNIMKSADIILLVLDGTSRSKSIEEQTILSSTFDAGAKRIVALNKIDLCEVIDGTPDDYVRISAMTGQGVAELKENISKLLGRASQDTELVICSGRQFGLLKKCLGSLDNAIGSLLSGMTGEFVSLDVRSAIEFLSEVTGDITTDDILESIFSNFCIGK